MAGLIPVAVGMVALAACAPEEGSVAGRAAYEANCAACHGSDGRGAASGLPDLTLLTARSEGRFPMALVLRRVDGYARGLNDPPSGMPELGHLLEGRLVRVELGDGRTTMTPTTLAAIADYLKTLQR